MIRYHPEAVIIVMVIHGLGMISTPDRAKISLC